MFQKIVALLIFSLLVSFAANARENDEWEKKNSAVINEWFRTLMQPDQKMVSCCGEADAYYADIYTSGCWTDPSFGTQECGYIAEITDDRVITNRPAIANGTRIAVPNQKIKFDGVPPNPTGHGVIFLSPGTVYHPTEINYPGGPLPGSTANRDRLNGVYCYVVPGGA